MKDTKSETDVFDNKRIVYFKGKFTEDATHSVIQKLLEFELKDPLKDIVLYIDSYGGYVDSFLAIHDAIRLCRCDVATVCIGKAMSCGQMLLISGAKGKRFITLNSRVLMHPVSSFA